MCVVPQAYAVYADKRKNAREQRRVLSGILAANLGVHQTISPEGVVANPGGVLVVWPYFGHRRTPPAHVEICKSCG